MKKITFIILIIFCLAFATPLANAQCSVCTKTATQMGEKPAKALNAAILYLMASPFLIVGFIGYRWWRSNGQNQL